MKKGFIIGIVVVIALIVIGFFFLNRGDTDDLLSTQTTQDTSQAVPAPGADSSIPETVVNKGEETSLTVITYTDDGFSPKNVTLSRGKSVRFVNESSRHFWPASNIHPTHTLYPVKTSADCLGSAFDACKAIAPGDSYEFTFSETGEWGYHDHLRANKRGAVIVR